MASLNEMFAERARVWEGMNQLIGTAERSKRNFTTEERSNYDRLEARLSALSTQIEAGQRHVRGALQGAKMYDNAASDPRTEEQRQAFSSYLRGNLSDTELRAQGVSGGSAGGFLVPTGFRNELIETLKSYSGVRQVAEVINTTEGNVLPWATNNDTANSGRILAENTQATETDLTFGSAQLGAYNFVSDTTLVSVQLLQDSAFDVEQLVSRKLGERIGRAQNPYFTTGTGTSQPQGIVTGATVGVTAATGGATSITYDNLVDLYHSVDPAYRNGNQSWMMADSTFAYVRKIKDSQGHPLLEPDVKAGIPNTILGSPVIINNDLPAMGASAKSILFGDFQRGYVIRDVRDVQVLRLNERWGDYLQIGFIGWLRSDGRVQDASAYKAFQHSAS